MSRPRRARRPGVRPKPTMATFEIRIDCTIPNFSIFGELSHMAEYKKSANYIKSRFRARRLRRRTSHLVPTTVTQAVLICGGLRFEILMKYFVLFRLRMPRGHFGLSRCWHSQKSKILLSTTFLSASHSTLGRMFSDFGLFLAGRPAAALCEA